jgi:hypothetical protein
MPVAEMTAQMALPGWFFRFIGTCELLGGIGLVLPMALRILPVLTAVAAGGLTLIMVGATVLTILGPTPAQTAVPAVVGMACFTVAYGRRRGASLEFYLNNPEQVKPEDLRTEIAIPID